MELSNEDRSESGHPTTDHIAFPKQLQFDLPKDLLPPERSDQHELLIGVAHRSPAAVSVDLFHHLFGLPRRPTPGIDGIPDELLDLRIRLIKEEADEFEEAAMRRDLAAMADALADLLYVTYGAAVTLGIDLDDVVAEVHASNLSKLGPDGRPILRSDGKVLKPDTYQPPDVDRVLESQPPLPRPGR